MSERRVVITGVGVVSPVGNDVETFWANLTAGKSGIRRIEAIDPEPYACQIAGEVKDFDPKAFYKNPKDARRNDQYAHYGVAAAKMALDDSGASTEDIDPFRFGCMVGSGIGGLQTIEMQHHVMSEKGPSRTSPFVIPMMISNIATGMISMDYGLRGPNMAIVTACATSNNNIGEAWRMIKFGDADAFVAGGAEAAIAPMGVAGFSAMKAMSTRNDEPERASRPFDKERDGFVMGEGAGVVVIEELETAKRRGAKIYCELAGYGASGDAYHLTAPDPSGEGVMMCMKTALNHGKINPEEVGYVNAHATSTPLGDICETNALKLTFGNHARNGLLVSSTKSMTGHLLGAAGGIEIAASIKALETGIIPPTINYEHPDPECDLDYVPNKAREAKLSVVASNGFGFGGHNSCLVIKRFEG
ncbi:MAG: beta-ketoacyl-ACP synthase II [Verrucomicrobiota bacterium]